MRRSRRCVFRSSVDTGTETSLHPEVAQRGEVALMTRSISFMIRVSPSMPAQNKDTGSNSTPAGQIPVSPDNPCPFLRALVAGGFVDGHVVPLSTLAHIVEAASGETGLKKKVVGIKTRMVALIANGLGPLRLWRSWRSGAVLDELRNGPLDKHGVGSRILGVDGQVNEDEITRLAGFGQNCKAPAGGTSAG